MGLWKEASEGSWASRRDGFLTDWNAAVLEGTGAARIPPRKRTPNAA